MPMPDRPSLLIVGHGSRSAAGVAEYWDFADVVKNEDPSLVVGCGFIELAEPNLDAAIDNLVGAGATSVVATPLVLLGAGHMKNDGPDALHRARHRHPTVSFSYARHLGIHPDVLEVAEERIKDALGAGDLGEAAVVLVSRGSSDPDANADLYKVARLLWDSRGLGFVEPAFVSLAAPDVPSALDRCRCLGARRIAVVPYFLFTGVLVDRIHEQAHTWAQKHPDVDVVSGPHLGPDRRIARLLLERYGESLTGDVRMNCDLCVYRVQLPGYPASRPHAHAHAHEHGGGR
ncbi:MAG TPA: sirohydrochlorin chelatase [Acidimicrobiales bacterium]|nr:sirohydrochlorin chelatase [Acidimicrobiales bacterium]